MQRPPAREVETEEEVAQREAEHQQRMAEHKAEQERKEYWGLQGIATSPDCIALAKAHEEEGGVVPVLDADFATDVEYIGLKRNRRRNP